MAIAKGVLLGPYEILNRIGEGGMGEVWRARDRRIGRDVAVKVLPDSFTRGDERILRFEQEARAAGALNHPGLVTIFDVGTTDGSPYIVMEYLEGENLREVLGDSVPIALPLRKVIDYAMQIAAALAVAHEKGIIHRDLKPENIFVTSDKRVKILDFGLAKLAAESTDLAGRHRTAKHLTSAGVAVGTPGYMSPEQVRAQPLDARTDIFSLGSVIYEMASGRPAFECFSAIETMHAVMNVEPPSLATFIPNIPPALDAIVRHCMEKNPRDRFQSTRDLAFQLQMLMPEVENRTTDIRRLTLPQPPAARRLPVRAAIAVTAVVLALAAGGWALFRAGAGASADTARTFRQLTFADGLETFPTLAPDGKSVAYVSSQSGNHDIYVQRVDGRTAINITSDSPDADAEPAFSPDGSFIAFRSEREGGGIFVMGVTGENVRRLTDFGHNPSWSPDGKRIVISTAGTDLRPHVHPKNGDLWIVDARTGARRVLLQHKTPGQFPGLMGSDAVQPSWSPHGNRIAFWGVSHQFAQRDIWTIEPDAPQPEQTVVRATTDPALHWNPVWSPDGRYLYYGSNRDGTLNLWRVAIDEESGKPTGTPEPLSLPAPISGNFGFSQQGELAYTTVTRLYRLLGLPFDAATGMTGEPITLFGGTQEILSFELSPDRQTIAFTTGGAQEDLFVANVDGTRLRQLTNDAARDRTVTWSSDGNTLFFSSNRDGGYHLWSIRADGSNLTRATDNGDLKRVGASNIYSPNASPDGQTLVGEAESGALLVHLDRPVARRLEVIGKGINAPKWSPDGKLLVGSTDADAAGRRGIGIYSFGTRRIEQVLPQGLSPQWLPGGRHVAFFADRRVGVLDLESRRETMHSVLPLEGVRLEDTVVKPRLSRDGTMLYVRQTLEQSDIWMVRFEKE